MANDKIRVKYAKGEDLDVYGAKVVKVEKNPDVSKERYLVHYAGWNTRYDEWIKRNRVVEVVRDKSPKRRGGFKGRRGPPPELDPLEGKKIEVKEEPVATPSKRGRPPSASGTRATEPSASVAKMIKAKKIKRPEPAGSPASELTEDTMSKGGEDSSACSDSKRIKSEPLDSKDEKEITADVQTDPDATQDFTEVKVDQETRETRKGSKVDSEIEHLQKGLTIESSACKNIVELTIQQDVLTKGSNERTDKKETTQVDTPEPEAIDPEAKSSGKRKRVAPVKDLKECIAAPKKGPQEKEEPKSAKKVKLPEALPVVEKKKPKDVPAEEKPPEKIPEPATVKGKKRRLKGVDSPVPEVEEIRKDQEDKSKTQEVRKEETGAGRRKGSSSRPFADRWSQKGCKTRRRESETNGR